MNKKNQTKKDIHKYKESRTQKPNGNQQANKHNENLNTLTTEK